MVVIKISLDFLAETLEKLGFYRTKNFWSIDSLTLKEKRNFHNETTTFVLMQFLLWCLALITIGSFFTTDLALLKFIFNEEWTLFIKTIFKICFIVFVSFSYYAANTILCYYAYIILHNYFQMKILMACIKTTGKYKRRNLKNKTFNNTYQFEMRDIFMRSIKQFQILKLLKHYK